jgi:DNA-binding LacI/PurR family transcriptional regulator
MSRSPTIRGVAARAGVSITTVSKFMNGMQRFSESVERRIQAAVVDLGYRHYPKRRTEKFQRTKTIALVVSDTTPQATSAIKGVNRAALRAGYGLHILDTMGRLSPFERKQIETIARRVEGFVISSRASRDYVVELLALRKPVVFIGRGGTVSDFPSVGCDGYRGARIIGQHLIERRHQSVAYIGFPQSPWDEERFKGLLHSLQPLGASLERVSVDQISTDQCEEAVNQLLSLNRSFDAVVCYNDMVAFGAMRALLRRGFRIPDEISIVGFDNTVFSQFTVPALTTIDTQGERAGELAMQLLVRQIHEGAARDIGHTVIEPVLIVRESTGDRTVSCSPADRFAN